MNLGGQGSDYAEYGLLLQNRSRTIDALDVAITVRGLDSSGQTFVTDQQVITVIPAGATFAVDGQLIWGVSFSLSRIKAVVHVGKTSPRGRTLPRVTAVAVTNGGTDVTASITNPYTRPLPVNAIAYGLFLDSSGRIVGAGDQVTGAVIGPGRTVGVDLFGNLSGSGAAAVKSAIVSVDPCGLDAGTLNCPIAGAR